MKLQAGGLNSPKGKSLVDMARENGPRSGLNVLWTLLRKPRWLQEATRVEATWPSETEVADWRGNILTPQDDGAHWDDSPFYSEWWYFDVSFGKNSALALIFHLTDIIRPASTKGSVNVSFFEGGELKLKRFQPYDRSHIGIAHDLCDVRIGENRCWVEADNYHVHIEEPGLLVDLVFESATVAWRPGNGRFHFGCRDVFLAWIVPQPRARVSGMIIIGDEEKQLDGWGYHDHNWGTVSLLDAVSEWSWGRAYLGDYTCVFADVHLSPRYGGSHVRPFALIRGDHVVMSSFLRCNDPLGSASDFLRHPRSAQPPEGWHLAGGEQGEQLDLVLRTQDVLERADLLAGSSIRQWVIEKLVAHPFYIRCYASVQGEWRYGDLAHALEGIAVYEQMSLRQ